MYHLPLSTNLPDTTFYHSPSVLHQQLLPPASVLESYPTSSPSQQRYSCLLPSPNSRNPRHQPPRPYKTLSTLLHLNSGSAALPVTLGPRISSEPCLPVENEPSESENKRPSGLRRSSEWARSEQKLRPLPFQFGPQKKEIKIPRWPFVLKRQTHPTQHICSVILLERHILIPFSGCRQSKLSPQQLEELQKSTHFDKKELQQWYKGIYFPLLHNRHLNHKKLTPPALFPSSLQVSSKTVHQGH